MDVAESGRSTPASLCSNATVADIPYSYEPSNDVTLCNNNNNKNVLAETLVEVAEEDFDEDDVIPIKQVSIVIDFLFHLTRLSVHPFVRSSQISFLLNRLGITP